MELEVFTTNVELQDIPSYSTTISVEGQLLKLSFLWNERLGKRVLSIKNTSDVVYLQNTILHPNEPLELNSNAVLDDLPYSVTLVKTGDVNKVGNIFNWSKDFILCFSRAVDLDIKKLNVVYGVTTPSTPTIPPIVRPEPPVQPPTISCEGATNTSGCISWTGTVEWEEGVIDLEVDGVTVLSNASKEDLETYLFNNGVIENDLTFACGCDMYVRSVRVPYHQYEQGQTLYLPVALKPNGQSITTPFTVQGETSGDRRSFIADTLNSQLEPYGLYCVYGLFASDNIYLGVPDNRAKFNYKETEFYILDEGNTFTSEQIPRGLPPYYCWMPT